MGEVKVCKTFREAWADGKQVWRQLLATDLAYKLLAFAVLTPLVGLALRAGISISGSSVLADQDILLFFIRPVGLFVLVVAAALAIAITALEQACLMTIGMGARTGVRIDAGQAMRFVLGRVRPVLGLAVRLVARALLLAAPFLAALGLIYVLLLRDFDINYYLAERPPAFLAAVGLAVLSLLAMAWVLVPRLVGWALALPLALFEGVRPGSALSESARRSSGARLAMARVLVRWGAGALLLFLVLPGAVLAVGRLLVPHWRGHVGIVLGLMAVVVAVWAVVSLLVSWVNATAFALLVVRLHVGLGGGRRELDPALAAAGALGGGRRLRLSFGRVLALLAAVAIAAGLVGFLLLRQVRLRDAAVVIAHRGAAATAPENTLASVEEAIMEGADFVEIDVQETADDEIAVLHDSDLMKVAGVDLKIWDATRERLATIDIGSWFDPRFHQERVPRLEDVLEKARGRARVVIELKYYGHTEALEQRVVDLVEKLGQADNVVVMSLEYDALRKMRALRPRWILGLLTAKAVGDLTALDADFLAVNAGLANRRFVKRAHEKGKLVYVWTVNDPVQMFRLLNLGVDGIITDRPALARWVIGRRAELSAAERLLVGIAFFFGAAAPDPPVDVDAPG
jgi:glycerophosphoryl diester phosphodiesterase